MARESLISGDRRVLFRETFDAAGIARNGGVITGGVTLNPDGTATFDGSTGYIRYPSFPLSSGNFALRLKLNIISLGVDRIFLYNGSGWFLDGWAVYLDSLNRLRFYMYDEAGTSTLPYITLTATGDYDLCFVCNRDTNKIYFYKDALQALEFTLPVGFGAIKSVGDLLIGATSVPSKYFDSTMSLVEIYQGKLTAEEISLLFSNKLYKGAVR